MILGSNSYAPPKGPVFREFVVTPMIIASRT